MAEPHFIEDDEHERAAFGRRAAQNEEPRAGNAEALTARVRGVRGLGANGPSRRPERPDGEMVPCQA